MDKLLSILNDTQRSISNIPKITSEEHAVFTARQIDTSLVLLSTTENSVVVEALINLCYYCDLKDWDVNYLRQRGFLSKLLTLLGRNICITRLVFRLLRGLIEIREVMSDLEQGAYDDQILKIKNIFAKTRDPYIKLSSVYLLVKLVKSCRIMSLVYGAAFFKEIVNTITGKPDNAVLEETLELFLSLLNSPAAVSAGPDLNQFDIANIVTHLRDEGPRMVHLCFRVVNKLAFYSPYTFENSFIDHRIIKFMFEVLTNAETEQYHDIAIDIINNCTVSIRVCYYFLESLEFLQFCQWVKLCDPKYHFHCIALLERLTRFSDRKQLLFDLSVEDAILSLFRSTEKKVLNRVCEAIINMNTHIYCMKKTLTPELIKRLFEILNRTDEEDPWNEVALNTIVDYANRSSDTLGLIQQLELHKVLLNYFHNTLHVLSEESMYGLLQMLFKMSLLPFFREDIATCNFFAKLLNMLDTTPPLLGRYVCRILSNFVTCPEFRTAFVSHKGPQVFLNKLKNPTDLMLLKEVLIFIRANLQYEDVADSFFDHNIVHILKDYPEILKAQVPLTTKLLTLMYNHHPSLKFFETRRLDVTDKLKDKFCLINGYWRSDFPSLAEFATLPVSPEYTLYIVDYSFHTTNLHQKEGYNVSLTSEEESSNTREHGIIEKNCSLYSDPFLPRLVSVAGTRLANCSTLKDKVKILAIFVDSIMGAPVGMYNKVDKVHNIMLHVAFLKYKMGNNLVPIGYLNQGSYCERSLLFKAIADVTFIPSTLVKGNFAVYWNEVPLFDETDRSAVKFYVVDLIKDVGNLLERGSRKATLYCTGKTETSCTNLGG